MTTVAVGLGVGGGASGSGASDARRSVVCCAKRSVIC